MKRILCYGDSNTHGYDAGTGGRFDEEIRWPRVMGRLLGPEFWVIEEGLNGRTTAFDDPVMPGRVGREALPWILQSHQPLDLLILMLGTNDLKPVFGTTASTVALGLEELLKVALNPYLYGNHRPPQVLVVSPILIGEGIEASGFREMFGGMRAREQSALLAAEYRRVAELYRCPFFDAARHARACDLDAVHLDAENHGILAAALAGRVRELL